MSPKYLLITLFSASLLGGCASNVSNIDHLERQSDMQAARSSKSPSNAISYAQSRLQAGKSADLAFYAPDHLEQATAALDNARSLQAKGEPGLAVRAQSQLVEKIVEAGLVRKEDALKTLKKSLDQRTEMLKIEANKYYPTEFTEQMARLAELLALVESNQSVKARQEQAELLADMKDLEVKTVKFQYLRKVEDQYQETLDKGANSLTPRTIILAQRSLASANQLITMRPRDKKDIQDAADAAAHSVRHAFLIISEVNRLLDLESKDAESTVLGYEQMLYRIAVAVKYKGDIRDQKFDEQSRLIAKKAQIVSRIAAGQ